MIFDHLKNTIANSLEDPISTNTCDISFSSADKIVIQEEEANSVDPSNSKLETLIQPTYSDEAAESIEVESSGPCSNSQGILVGVELPKQSKKKSASQIDRGSRQRSGCNSSESLSALAKPMQKRPGALSEADVALPLIVLDVPNIAMRHGLNKEYSCRGAELAFEFFLVAGHRVVGFIPDYALDAERISGLERAAKIGAGSIRSSQIPNDVALLRRLVDQGLIIATPPQDYDDSYCIKYALRHNGYVVTNDMYRDHLENIQDKRKRTKRKSWLKAHLISYTFVGDEFFPNPDFSFLEG